MKMNLLPSIGNGHRMPGTRNCIRFCVSSQEEPKLVEERLGAENNIKHNAKME
jgi:hypothetical protein